MKKSLSFIFLSLMMLNVAILANATPSPQDTENTRHSLLKGDVLDVELRNPGTLANFITPGDEKRVRCIRLSGTINGDDIKTMKSIFNRSSAIDENGRSVSNYIDLEIEKVRIVGGGSNYSTRTEHDVISNRMFSHFSCLRSIFLPRMIKRIDKEAFYGCYKLEEVRFMRGTETRSIGDEAFRGCSKLSRINLPDAVETLGDKCFYECTSLQRIELPYSLRAIGKEAFYNVPITSINFPPSLTYVGRNAFNETQLTLFYIPQQVEVEDGMIGQLPRLREFQVERGNNQFTTEDGALYDIDGTTLLYYPMAKGGECAVPQGVVAIREEAFSGNSHLNSVTFPNSLRTIGKKAFKNCTSLRTIYVPEGVTTMGEAAFANCSHMTTATIDASVSILPAEMFVDCGSLQSVVLPNNLVTIGESSFENCKLLQSMEWGSALTTIMKNAFKKCGFVNVELPSSVKVVQENAFRDCKSLISIALPSGIMTLEKEIFRGCDKLVDVVLPAKLETIGENLFRDCKLLSHIELPMNVTTIYNNAFRGTALTELTLPASVQKIGDKILEKCKITRIICHASQPPVLGKISDKKAPLFVPAGAIDAYKQAKPWKDFKNIQPIQ